MKAGVSGYPGGVRRGGEQDTLPTGLPENKFTAEAQRHRTRELAEEP
jgi:hypothetical protein